MESPEKSTSDNAGSQSNITDSQRARAERNKLKARQILQAKLVAHPYIKK